MLGGNNDLAYFSDLYETGGAGTEQSGNTSQFWNERAERWGRELSTDCPFRRSMDERVMEAAQFLRAKGVLRDDSTVVDIGCGPGRYVAEFAKTARHVTGIDISERMLKLAEVKAGELGHQNVSFVPCDFQNISIEEKGWAEKFDLVFTSITPAVSTVESLEKSIKMCKGFCFNSDFLYWRDELEEQIARDVFNIRHEPQQKKDWRFHYALFNLLFLKGYQPETHYHRQKTDDKGPINIDMARYYASIFTQYKDEIENNTKLVYRYMEKKSDANGIIAQRYERWYAWILWDVRVNTGLRHVL